MKKYLATLLILASLTTNAQTIKTLKEALSKDTIQSGQGIIYGLFIQRLGFSSGGFPQDIRIVNINTREIFSFRVKPTFKSAKENIFSFHIPPGDYAIIQYWWTQSKWYGGKMFTEPIFKNYAFSEIEAKLKSSEIKEEELEHFKFSIQPNTLNYVGSWHFDKEQVSFSHDKVNIDKKVTKTQTKLNFGNAAISIPN
jgi:hypothetical protein